MPARPVKRLPSCFSHAIISLQTRCRFYATNVLAGDALGPIEHNGQKHQSLRVLKDGGKLPLPPVLDPVVLSERQRWQQPKQQPNVAEFTPFQKKLWQNPYAHTLASPLRECRATFTLLPTPLLTTLHPRPHPTTAAPWLLPVSLTTTQKHLGPPYRFLSHAYITAHLTKKRVWERGLYPRLVEKLGKGAVEKMVWREDMPALVLELLRKKVAGKLGWYFARSGALVPCSSPRREDLEGLEDVSCVLYLGSLRTRADDLQAEVAEMTAEGEKWVSYFTKGFAKYVDPHKAPGVTHSPPHWFVEPVAPRLQPRVRFPPLEFKTTLWRGRKVPVYSLPDMLSEEMTRELIRGSKHQNERCLVMKMGEHNVAPQILLMQLQAYLAEPGP
ncbi:hypothetical protein K458DRAFT_300451 [Lentithecium fluviatile CBS 122367]|uniref:Uncharacterized protein n=1 Tax=Lentithecium fluviatile CBS 122367 TaxID=1168545 RepID=A0A6G1J517_9PLEO|nr:hypothetical protein K458DRAFT_300451 [Lentithecium fluviatile CBS 122367]